MPGLCLGQVDRQDHPQHVSVEHCYCELSGAFRIKFDDTVKELLPETLLDMKRALYEVCYCLGE